jgi:subtilase family serine protease
LGGAKGAGIRTPAVIVATLFVVASAALEGPAASATPYPSNSPPVPLSPVGTVPTLPAGSTQVGTLASATPIEVSVVLKPFNPAGLAAVVAAVSNPASPSFRHYLTPAELEAQFGPSAATVSAVDSYLQKHGLTVDGTRAEGLIVNASGTAGQVTGALHTGIARYKERSGSVVYANTSAPKMPSTLAPAVTTVNGLDDTTTQVQPLTALAQAQTPSTQQRTKKLDAPSGTGSSSRRVASNAAATPCSQASNIASSKSGYTANVLASTYSLSSLYNSADYGQGVTIAIFELANFVKGDIRAFKSCYGIKTNVSTFKVDGGAPVHGVGSLEADLDIETIMSLAPKAKIVVYVGPLTDQGLLDTYGAIADSSAQVVSTSWGACEFKDATLLDTENSLFRNMVALGKTVVASSGDSGSEDCYPGTNDTALAVDDPGSQPYVTGVGGTDLTGAPAKRSETTWNDSTGAGGGGLSLVWPLQSWEFGPGVINSLSGCPGGQYPNCREVPDVSASASALNGYVVYCTVHKACTDPPGWQVIGGTSAAAPLWAAVFALADQGAPAAVGFANPLLYEIAANPAQSSAFNDVTTGNNDWTNSHHGEFPATANYDMATGLGTPNASVLVPLLR